MEIRSHLSEAELAEFISDPSRGLGTHLQFCNSCLGEVARMREAVAAMRLSGTECEEFWMRQRIAIRTKVADADNLSWRGFPRMAWVGALAIAVAAGLLLGDGARPAPRPLAHQLETDPDHALLVAVEQVMRSDGPEALEPAAYLVREISQDARSTSTSSNRK